MYLSERGFSNGRPVDNFVLHTPQSRPVPVDTAKRGIGLSGWRSGGVRVRTLSSR